MPDHQESYLSGANVEFIEALYARFLEDPQSVDESWRALFEALGREGRPIFMDGKGAVATLPGEAPAPAPAAPSALQARVDQTLYAFRLRGHLLARLDPLGRPRPPLSHVADLGMVSDRHFSPEELEQRVSDDVLGAPRPLRELLDRLRRTYCGQVGVEFMHLLDGARRRWLLEEMERTENRTRFSAEEQRRVLTKLSQAEAFESFLHTKYVGAKRFSLDGGESLVPMLDAFLELGGELGVKEVVIGMAHRGRLNLLTNVLGKSPDQVFSEFEGPEDPTQYLNRGDVKYHQGFSSDYLTQGGSRIHLSLAFNPSHLEAVYPVVEGRVRAKQDRAGDREGALCVPLVIHGDASFAGQGVVAETLNLSGLSGYRTGGTLHVVIDNQVGFTTLPEQSRTAHYSTAVATMLDVPIFHVNGDDPEACVHVMRLATRFRQRFQCDVVVELTCFRRYGHNEGDEPAFTQPRMYELIRAHPTVRGLYAERLAEEGRVDRQEAEAIRRRCLEGFQEAHRRTRDSRRLEEASFNQGLWRSFRGGPDRDTPEVDTGVPLERLKELLRRLTQVPEGFTPHPKIRRGLEARRALVDGRHPLEWSTAEALALGSLLLEGHSVRLTGQDTERGTFSQRHGVLHDVKTGATYAPLAHLSDVQGDLTLLNSPLSELACLGFEYGYSLDFPDALVAWEAQFGDFVNSAQVIVDQFLAAGEDKWRRLSGLTLLLPHGYEGQGPEHSSARLERFLELCAEDNLQVCYPTTPGQYFHLLRRQVLRPLRKPLVVMTPKSLLRKPEATSPLAALSEGRFLRVLPDRPEVDPRGVTRLLLCSGKVFYDLAEGREERKDLAIGLVRLEQLYPFPEAELSALLSSMPDLAEVYWVQEEPRNMGGWAFIAQRLPHLLSEHPARPRHGFIGRVESASPATGFHDAHVYEQQLIVDEATSREG